MARIVPAELIKSMAAVIEQCQSRGMAMPIVLIAASPNGSLVAMRFSMTPDGPAPETIADHYTGNGLDLPINMMAIDQSGAALHVAATGETAARGRAQGLARRLEAVRAASADKFAELCRMLSFRLGLGAWDALSEQARSELELEAGCLIDEWDVAAHEVDFHGGKLSIDSPLRTLLNEIQAISEQVLFALDQHDKGGNR